MLCTSGLDYAYPDPRNSSLMCDFPFYSLVLDWLLHYLGIDSRAIVLQYVIAGESAAIWARRL